MHDIQRLIARNAIVSQSSGKKKRNKWKIDMHDDDRWSHVMMLSMLLIEIKQKFGVCRAHIFECHTMLIRWWQECVPCLFRIWQMRSHCFASMWNDLFQSLTGNYHFVKCIRKFNVRDVFCSLHKSMELAFFNFLFVI